jgi:hypothetical protein
MQEEDNYRFWVTAGGDPKKFKWSRVPSESRDTRLGDKIIDFAKAKRIAPMKGDVYNVAVNKDWKLVFRVDGEDGVRFVDQDGNPVAAPADSQFVASKHRALQDVTRSVSGKV